MAVALYRVDDRLIHGQVIVGWGQPLGIKLVILVDEEVNDASWEQELYRSAMPPGVEVRFAGIEGACRELPSWNDDPRKTVLLTGTIEEMAALARCQPGLVREVNLGGIHHRPGRTRRLPYVYLSEAEVEMLKKMEGTGVHVVAQDLPSTAGLELGSIA